MAQILALGDCNTSGDILYAGNAYPERFGKRLMLSVTNAGYTMSTTREMQYLFHDYYTASCEVILIQYGLVDSWKTFKYAPYVLYYPDNPLRKFCRKIVKKYKKMAKKIGLNKYLGTKNVVPVEEYVKNIEKVIQTAQDSIIILIDTIPNHQLFRNDEIKRYNRALDDIAEKYSHCYRLKIYQLFERNMNRFYADETHINDIGYDTVASLLEKLYSDIRKQTQ